MTRVVRAATIGLAIFGVLAAASGCSGQSDTTCTDYLAMDRAARAAVIKATQNPGHLEMGDDFWISGYDGPIVTYCREPGHEDTAIKDLYLSVG